MPSLRATIRPDHINRAKGYAERGRPFAPGNIDWSTAVDSEWEGYEIRTVAVNLTDERGQIRSRQLVFIKMGRNWQFKNIWM